MRPRHGERDVGHGLEQPIGDLLKPGGVGQVRVLVQDRRDAPPRGREAAEGRRAVAVHVQDVDPLRVDETQHGGKRERVELAALEIGDVDAERVERFFRQVLLAKADERDVEPVAIEARDHPAEQPLDAVHPRPLPSEVVADLQHVQRSHAASAAS